MNLKHFFYRQYFDFDDPDAQRYLPGGKLSESDKDMEIYYRGKNTTLTSHVPNFEGAKLSEELGNVQPLLLIVQNPGLLPGSGYPHEVGGTGEFKLGFSVDHTTGLPVLPGSSVKGVLRSVFPQFDYDAEKPWIWQHPEDNGRQSASKRKVRVQKAKFIVSLLGKQGITIPDRKAEDIAHALELAIFDGWDSALFPEQKAGRLPMGRHDVFFDALPIIPGKLITGEDRLLGRDALTPHGSSPLKNPTPLPFVKVLPGVTFEFKFRLYDSRIFGQTLTAEQKRALFSKILCTVGAGAKTNVGYGQFADPEAKPESGHSAGEQKTAQTATSGPAAPARAKLMPFNKHLGGKTTIGKVSRVEGERVWFHLPEVEGFDGETEIRISPSLVGRFQPGSRFELKISEANPAKNILIAKVHNYIAK
jgi:CRISPR-associated protein Cmr6